MEIVSNEEYQKDPMVYVKKILDLWLEIDLIIKQCFSAHIQKFSAVRDRAFITFVNFEVCSATFLAIYADN